MLTLLTATGERPEAWALCQKWMQRQTFTGPVRWIIVDDGEQPQPITFERKGWTLEVVRPQPFWRPGENTQSRNLMAGLARVGSRDWLAIIEDDDWYAPDWLERVTGKLELAELVGEGFARYYNVAYRKARQLTNDKHASLCACAMRGEAIQALRNICRTSPEFLDVFLWQSHPSRVLFAGHRVVGIKGLPGRGGIGVGHSTNFMGDLDPSGAVLKSWIGEDAAQYLPEAQ